MTFTKRNESVRGTFADWLIKQKKRLQRKFRRSHFSGLRPGFSCDPVLKVQSSPICMRRRWKEFRRRRRRPPALRPPRLAERSTSQCSPSYTQNQRMLTHLDTILASTRSAVASAKICVPASELEKLACAHRPRGWAAALRRRAVEGPAVIAEIKKASPSKGLIRADFDVAHLAKSYRKGGATALSVLTDEPFFQGSLRNLEIASSATPLPCLRKDFLVDEYQIVEARAHCADAILLIAAALTDAELKRFAACAHGFELDVLVEVHTGEELDRVLNVLGASGADAIGVNNRDLKTFEVKFETSLTLVQQIPQDVLRVTESGIATATDIDCLRAAGFNAFLIGESLMRQPDPGAALAVLLAEVVAAR